MKRNPRFLHVLFLMCITSLLLAHVNDDVWQVYRTYSKPTLDGEMDDIYKIASNRCIVIPDAGEGTLPESYMDCYAEARLLWDDMYLYVFIKVVDDEISATSASSYENDSAEIYFDGDNSKGDAYDGIDDVQTRIEYQDGSDASLYDLASGDVAITCMGAIDDWVAHEGEAFGYTIEAAYALTDLGVDMEVGSVFGLEIQINDRDNEARETMLRWWGNDNMAWQQPSLFGEAELVSVIAGSSLPLTGAYETPVIDGILDDVWIDQTLEYSAGNLV